MRLTYILSNLSRCYADVPVIFQVQGLNLTGFLSTDKIIRLASTIVRCDNTSYRILRISDRSVIRIQCNRVEAVDPNTILQQGIDTSDTSPDSNNEFVHYGGVYDAMDVVKSYADAMELNEMGHSFVAFADTRYAAKAYEELQTTWWQRANVNFYWALGILIALICCCGTVWLLTCADCCICKCFCKPCRDLIRRRKAAAALKSIKMVPPQGQPIELQVLMPPTSFLSLRYLDYLQHAAVSANLINAQSLVNQPAGLNIGTMFFVGGE